ncbi:hypothetical protein [Mesorhizobium sp.]|uniref:hypothetical protein n=1 Tax=Mesorhizobium sp. TaxID=1871066 RepID=UPI002590556A|nr:hypothetical protein [Mesorhizobium sp.]
MLARDRFPFLIVDRVGDIGHVECNARVGFAEPFALSSRCDDQAAASAKRCLPCDRLDPGQCAVAALKVA